MDYKKIGPTAILGFGALVAGVVAVLLGRPRGDRDAQGGGTASGDTAPAATLATGDVGKAETEKNFRERPGTPANEHVPTDLLSDTPVTAATRAPDAFRPDPTAVPTAEEREALRPATGPAPTLVADRGSVNA